jgi:hypothetical protein
MPNVVVKKSDGTFTSVPLEQFKKPAASQPVQVAVPQKSLVSPSSSPQVVSPPPRFLAKQPVVPLAKLSSQDFTSPLEEPLETKTIVPSSEKSFADTHVMNVLKVLSFKISKEHENRLQTVVQLCIKQVRTDEQTQEICQRALAQGGLGLSEKQATELLQSCHEELRKMHPEYGTELPATTTPFNAFKHAQEIPSTLLKNRNLAAHVSIQKPSILEAPHTSARRPVMKDVTYQPMTLGPIEELQALTLTDIRRLAPITQDAFARFGQKLVNLKNESIILFFEGRDAYHRGPVYEEYTAFLIKSLTERRPLERLLTNPETWTFSEIKELVGVEKKIGL